MVGLLPIFHGFFHYLHLRNSYFPSLLRSAACSSTSWRKERHFAWRRWRQRFAGAVMQLIASSKLTETLADRRWKMLDFPLVSTKHGLFSGSMLIYQRVNGNWNLHLKGYGIAQANINPENGPVEVESSFATAYDRVNGRVDVSWMEGLSKEVQRLIMFGRQPLA